MTTGSQGLSLLVLLQPPSLPFSLLPSPSERMSPGEGTFLGCLGDCFWPAHKPLLFSPPHQPSSLTVQHLLEHRLSELVARAVLMPWQTVYPVSWEEGRLLVVGLGSARRSEPVWQVLSGRGNHLKLLTQT